MNTKDKTYWIMLLFILARLLIGAILGDVAKDVPSLAFFGYGKTIGLENLNLDLGFLKVAFGFTLNLNIASFIGLIISLLLYKWLIRS